jgi:signal transduction histidine kinase
VSLHPVVLSISSILAVSLALYVARFRRAPGSGTFVVLLLAIAGWCMTAFGHWAAPTLEAKMAWARFQYIAIAAVPPLTFLFACAFVGSWWPRRLSRAFIWLIPALTVGAAFTNDRHGALWPSVTLAPSGSLAIYEHGWWFWVAAAHAYVLMCLGALVIARALRQSSPAYRGQFTLLLAGAVLPWAGNLAYVSGVVPIEGLDITPLLFTLSGVLFAYALSHNGLFDLVPVARDQLVDSLADAVIVLDASRRVLDLNAAARRLAAGDRSFLDPRWFGRTFDELLPQLDAARITLGPALQSNLLVDMPSRDGMRHFDVTVTPVRTGDQRLVAWAVLLRDVSDQRRAAIEREALEKRVQEQQKRESLSVLAGGLAHDFNNLLAGIIGNADLLAMRIPRESEMTSHVGAILLGAQRAADLVSKMLAYAGERHGTTEEVDLDAIVREMLDLLEASVARHCTLRYEGTPVRIFADPVQIRQVVMNLIINAAEAVDDHGGVVLVTVGAERLDARQLGRMELADEAGPGEYAFLDVRDNGPGMDEITLRRIFTPFYTTKPTGHGLGLAAVHGIVRGHRGALRVDTSVGVGSQFTVWLPVTAREGQGARREESGRSQEPGSSLNVGRATKTFGLLSSS